ncbi:hypothetical protein KP509_03G048600 [Ceratopteris richardii]|uniref:HMG box domain-containing protein n=1 Tax=Ceratopteris richardii TaxID=49495 RepID=A0A8T2UZM6_CERRI|nr:hypothetical protein KP509_03G048600 [Ceratopteris richardii]
MFMFCSLVIVIPRRTLLHTLAEYCRNANRKTQLSVKEQKARKTQAKKERKAKMDPNKPKRPPTAFFIYLEDFRKAFKEELPDVGKACGDKWKEMTDDDDDDDGEEE